MGIVLMLAFQNTSKDFKSALFMIAHPGHVILSAMVTASMLRCHSRFKKNFILVLIFSWIGAIGVATVSDVVIPQVFGTTMFKLNIPIHEALHEHEEMTVEDGHHDDHNHQADQVHQHGEKIHFAFIENWAIINPAAILGFLIGFFRPATKFPHSTHVLISTWASGAYILMTATVEISTLVWFGILVVLFISVWIPCCVSDIIFPLLFVDGEMEHPHCCHGHSRKI